jgi:SAM-dependent methyltransferase/uncharacterized protein YbaR (Trm112 family)
MESWLLEALICPRHLSRLEECAGNLMCGSGCAYPVVQGIPVLLRDDADQTLWVATASLEKAWQLQSHPSPKADPCIETLGLSQDERVSLAVAVRSKIAGIDPVVSYLVGATNGILYKDLRGRLSSYPIPELQLPAANGALFLDIGCNWGRWCVAAARRGYCPVGIDPSLGAVLAAERVCSQLGVNAQFVVGDSRYLPFATDMFELVFSYSTLQHFSRDDVRATLREVARILKPGGRNMIQMANAYGIRSLYHQARRGFRDGREFDVRYWTPAELNATFERFLGSTSLSVDCFFGLGIQDSDEYLLPLREKLVVRASRVVKSISERLLPLQTFADSVYVCSVNRKSVFPSLETRV